MELDKTVFCFQKWRLQIPCSHLCGQTNPHWIIQVASYKPPFPLLPLNIIISNPFWVPKKAVMPGAWSLPFSRKIKQQALSKMPPPLTIRNYLDCKFSRPKIFLKETSGKWYQFTWCFVLPQLMTAECRTEWNTSKINIKSPSWTRKNLQVTNISHLEQEEKSSDSVPWCVPYYYP